MKLKMSSTHFFEAAFIDFSFSGDVNISFNFVAHYFVLSASNKNPVTPSYNDSVGPPELHARGMHPQYIASTGTMPKCSFSGV